MPFTRNLKRGDIVWLQFSPTVGSEQGGERPALVISPGLINERSPVILVASVTSQKTERIYPFEVRIDPPDGGLTTVSKVSLMQIRSIDKRRILDHLGSVSEDTIARMETALKIATGLAKV